MTDVVTIVQFCFKPSVIQCDGKCEEAWGINWHEARGPKIKPAPRNPGTYEGGEGKPQPPYPPARHNKWCARECERSTVKPLDGFNTREERE